MLPDRVSNPGPLTYESGVLPIALRGPAILHSRGRGRGGGSEGGSNFLGFFWLYGKQCRS